MVKILLYAIIPRISCKIQKNLRFTHRTPLLAKAVAKSIFDIIKYNKELIDKPS